MNGEAYGERVKVSVIMPAYNEEEYIEDCFNRVVNVLKDYGEPSRLFWRRMEAQMKLQG